MLLHRKQLFENRSQALLTMAVQNSTCALGLCFETPSPFMQSQQEAPGRRQ